MSKRPLVALAALLAVGLVLVGLAQVPGRLGDQLARALAAANPFRDEAVDRTGPAVLQELVSMQEFVAARGYYEVVVDFRDDSNLPDFLDGNRVIYVGKGDVEARVDFSGLDARRVTASEDGRSVTVELPAPELDVPRLDLDKSYVALLDEGLLPKFQGSDIERRAQARAVSALSAAAAGEGELLEIAEESTERMLRGLFTGLGYTDVEVTFAPSPRSRS